jgi:hypothetical protein
MNGVDYTRKLDRERELYSKSIKDNNRNNKEHLEAMKTSFDHKTKSQESAHIKQKHQLEKNFNDRYTKLDNAQKESLINKNQAYEKAILSNEDQFHDERRANQKNFTTRFSDLKDDFSTAQELERNSNKLVQDGLKENYEKRVGTLRKDADVNLKAYQENAIGDNKEVNEKMQTEKRQLIANHEKDLNSLQKQEIEKRNDLKERVVSDVNKIRENQNAENIASRARAKENFKQLTDSTTDKVRGLQNHMEEESSRMTDAQQKEIKKQNIGFSDRFTQQEKRYNRNLREAEIKHRAQGIGAGSINAEIADKQKVVDKTATDRRIATILNERVELQDTNERMQSKATETFQDTYKDLKLDHADSSDKQKRQMTEASTSERLKERNLRAEQEHNHAISLQYKDTVNETKINDLNRKAKSTINNLKENYSKSMAKAVGASEENFSTARDAMNAEKRILQKKLHEENSENATFLRQQSDEKMALVTGGLEKKVDALENQNRELQLSYESKINHIVQKTSEEVQRQQRAFKATADNEVKLERDAGKTREKQLTDNMRLAQKNFDRRLNEQRIQNHGKLNETTFNYEKKLKDQETKFQGIIDTNKKFYDREQARLNLASDTERERLISQYENKVEKLQEVNRQKIREMEEFSKISMGLNS